MNPAAALQQADWRRQTAALYARVREHPDPAAAHALWRHGRDQMMRSHPQSPLPAADPIRARSVPYWPYDPALRWTVRVEPVPRPQRLATDTGPDGVTRLEQAGWVTFADPVRQRVAQWWLDQYGGGLFLPLRDANGRHHQLRRRPLPARHGQGRRSRLGRPGPCHRPELPVPPVLPLRQPLGLPARAERQHHRPAHPGRGGASPAMSPGRRLCVQVPARTSQIVRGRAAPAPARAVSPGVPSRCPRTSRPCW